MRTRLRACDAWMTLGLLVLAYEVAAPPGQLLSEGVDRALECAPWSTRLGVVVTAAHLLNVLPERFDPYAHFAKFGRR